MLLFFPVATMAAQPPPPVSTEIAPRTLSYVYSNKVGSAGTVDELSTILKDAFSSLYSVADDAVPDLYGKATGYLTIAKPIITQKKGSSRANPLFSACSLATLAAVMQMVQARYDRDLRFLQKQRGDAQEKIRFAHQRICELESAGKSRPKKEMDPKFSEMQSPQIQVNSDARGTVISVSDILFETGSTTLTPELIASLTRFAKILLTSANYRVMVEGHTDNRGPESYNQTLSEQRAQSVLQFLTGQGIAPERLSATGYGMSRPIDDNETTDGRKRNRRVDLVVQEADTTTGSAAVGVGK
jgi:outer membrane protein OmpA-like peptidoglycan-associated protein